MVQYSQEVRITIDKNPLYGNAYVSAVYDNEQGRPKLEPLQCRIVKENFPINENELRNDDSHFFRLIKSRSNTTSTKF